MLFGDHTIRNEAIKAAPPVITTLTAYLGGFTLNEWAAIATIAYVTLQIGFLLYDRLWRKRNRK